MTRLSAAAVVCVVLLRLLCGWHFYNEGLKKLDPEFSSAGFLRTAKGPFAPLFRSMTPGYYEALELLPIPVEQGSLDSDTQVKIDAWRSDYGKRAAEAAKDGKPMPSDIPPETPGADWAERIGAGWSAGLERLGRLGADVDAMSAVRDRRLGEVVNYLHSQSTEIDELRHEAWRVEQMKQKAGPKPAPFQQERIAQAEAELWRTMQPWIATVEAIEDDMVEEIVTESDLSPRRVHSTMQERSLLSFVDTAVTIVVLGAGICVFFGVATRLAAVLAAGFLLSLIMTQPPWVEGADLGAFFTWAIEMAAFLVLATIGAGRWAGIDGLLHQCRLRFGDLSPTFARSGDQGAATVS